MATKQYMYCDFLIKSYVPHFVPHMKQQKFKGNIFKWLTVVFNGFRVTCIKPVKKSKKLSHKLM
ncbi:hypothetical protein VCRA2113O325_110102 [Vibrio crassostreae]|nr:hypothetical protein VCRA2113O323_110103 [Vibrio crassostreae]CAK2591130.1 hypothetical protein VCRA2113O325_110102 [Vibrio crassostreae]